MDASWKKNYVRYKTVLLGSLDQYQRRGDIKVYIEIILSLLTITIFSIFALRPTLITIAQLIKDIDSKRDTLEKMESKLASLDEAQILFDRERDNIANLRIAIPFSPEPNIYIRQVEGVASKTTNVTNMSIGEAVILGQTATSAKKPDQTSALPENTISTDMNVSAESDLNNYSAVYEFFKSIENLRTPLKIDSFTLNLDESQEGQKFLIVFINGKLVSLNKNK
ncbi:MAG: hypothetical protein US62_C0019G0019 [Candidatus Woesebacteria bacterium GW2011_GWA1_37_8]|uniref:Uncharacterized protein n=2 Tax=Candidatus Woeseibacteriota TaxID=1752722 RepID=A0A0G0NK82_9BACT|nr:MAG: hypothetical protein US39_C0002G0018 [Microgenomates group bacterium GW2011_GWC1_37_12b]KKQ44987.1 MAG: hypothetical protein US62_C0019G0019 [Candidatus Woesebacteria bacterium GW2011_GWA1_37_8]KKQ86304.1 MAG: hypothetical protein UT10_C0030G0004 [Candidatus Woesebacteria bacterium GW2011_GWB1_38_8b]